ncbi:hypothetical protein HanRHA438_Chr09g0383191 [Helianthus annuus]|nr:hypothetical protein HanHA300_Chr09g0305171 [Helianthus annuus]KAJ0541195.1 hypothetical protein HanHA89_Chr09g0325661 [Helianthus annuus]KAJ0706277.1 hypothetical protein HanLR1_Chr09g0305161 [Helianthus annuus]KAJ0886766.1 hypothetical protein HanRHA438_Chr09g0383191 [Helianthus annuus]
MENKLIPQSESSLGFFGVIRESFKTTSRNGKRLFSILFLVFLSYSQVDFLQEYTLAPATNYFMWQLANHPNIVHDLLYNFDQTSYAVDTLKALREIVLLKLCIIEISSIVTLIFLVATVCSSYEAYTAKVLGTKDLILKIFDSWNRSLLTSFYLVLLSLGITFFYAIVIVITSFLPVNSGALLFLGVIALTIPICCIYMATVWMVSLIVSVLEEGSSGLTAIRRAAELMKDKRLQASLMMVLFVLADRYVLLVAKVLASYGGSLSIEFVTSIPFTNGFDCLLKLFMFVVYTVFYQEWKTSHDENEGKGFYLPIVNVKA